MEIGICGLGTVGGSLFRWFKKNTDHKIKCYDPFKNLTDDFKGIDAAFISVPVPPADNGQDLSTLIQSTTMAKQFTENVFIRSTVLPATSDALKSIACPEFLTARRADLDMDLLPLLVGGPIDINFVQSLFPEKPIIQVSNVEAELAKFAHNCFGATKVTYFNMIHNLAQGLGADYENVMKGVHLTGFIEKEHTQVPGPDGRFGYGGTCFPQNVESIKQFLHFLQLHKEHDFFKSVQSMNRSYRLEQQEPLKEDFDGVDA